MNVKIKTNVSRLCAALIVAAGVMAAHAAPTWQEGTTYSAGSTGLSLYGRTLT
ncbi:hypothetical protein JHS3_17630 [Jeongeupia sp. HS-3]|uniref:hypothetical protein n=1 Tax=Jeongeupia sp. HS-3 TaxID=1009682 RepID=UPI0018A421FF|nr:hypothetical protein [Jeongeupia sp. HS-3]BCL76027.1 hypothetical protein JHS3_17630 [Jeongeupia sp. HS-3]